MENENLLIEENTKNINHYMKINSINNLFNYIAEMQYTHEDNSIEISTCIFVKFKLSSNDEKKSRFFCTAYHAFMNLPRNFYEQGGKIKLILCENNTFITKELIIKNENIKRKIIIFEESDLDLIFIEILEKDGLPKNSIYYIDLSENERNNYFSGPKKHEKQEIVIIGFHILEDEYTENKDIKLLLGYGHIFEVDEIKKDYNYNLTYKIETHCGVSGAPVFIIKDDKIELIGYHKSSTGIINYNQGKLFPTLKIIEQAKIVYEIPVRKKSNYENNDSISLLINNDDNFDNILLIKKLEQDLHILQEYDQYKKYSIALSLAHDLDKIKDEFNIFYYYNIILNEIKNERKKRYKLYHQLLGEHISKNLRNEIDIPPSKIMEMLKSFNDCKKNYKQIINDRNEYIKFFNNALNLEDSILLARSTYFIARFIDVLEKNNYNYKETKVELYCRMKLDYNMLRNLEKLRDQNRNIITFKKFLQVIPKNIYTLLYQFYYDSKKNLSNYKDVVLAANNGYDTEIYIYQNFDTDKYRNNFYKISNTEIIICPYSFFTIKEIKKDIKNLTATLKLTSIGLGNSIENLISIKYNIPLIYDEKNNVIDIEENKYLPSNH